MQSIRYDAATGRNIYTNTPTEHDVWEAVILAMADYIRKKRTNARFLPR